MAGEEKTNLSLAGYGSDTANLAAFESIDNATLPDVRVSDETDGDLLLIRMQLGKLAKELDEGALAKRVIG